jgi:hypothetical protein
VRSSPRRNQDGASEFAQQSAGDGRYKRLDETCGPWQSRKKDTSNLSKAVMVLSFRELPANYGFTVIVKVKPGRENAIREYGKTIEQAVKDSPTVLAPLRLHYLRWVLFDVGSGLHFMYQASSIPILISISRTP